MMWTVTQLRMILQNLDRELLECENVAYVRQHEGCSSELCEVLRELQQAVNPRARLHMQGPYA